MFDFTQVTPFWIGNTLLVFLTSVLLTGIIIPKIILIAFRKKLFDEVDERKVHRGVVPRLGGIAFFPAIISSIALAVGLDLRFGSELMEQALATRLMPFFFEICAVILLYLIGIADDLIGVRYSAKFIVQIMSAVLLVGSGMYVGNLYGLLWINAMPMWLSVAATAFLVVYVVNAVNLIDGIDGLASGLSMIALIFYATVFFLGGEYIFAMLAAASAGTLFPFFYYNVFGDAKKQKKIFMGDTGALTTGMILVFCAVAVTKISHQGIHAGLNPVIVALSPLAIPCFDVCRVYMHRVRRGRNPFLPDKCHIHHKLLAMGFNQAMSLIVILVASVAFIGVNVMLSPWLNPTLILLCDIVMWVSLNLWLTHMIRLRERRRGVTLYD